MHAFFYGLFMDETILEQNGVNPSNPRMAFLEDYALFIGNRASLIPKEGERSYGILMTVEQHEMDQLYSEPSVADYIPKEVVVTTEDGDSVEAVCYNLPLDMLEGTNESYAKSLYELAVRLGFPADYLEKIRNLT